MQKRKRNAASSSKPASLLLMAQQPKPDTAKRLSHHHHVEEEDICPVCDSECNCANAASTIAQPPSQTTSFSSVSASPGCLGPATPTVVPVPRYTAPAAVSTTRNKKSSNTPIKRTKLTRQPVSRRNPRGPISPVDEHEQSSVSSSDIEEVVLLSKGAIVRKQSNCERGGAPVVIPDSDFSFGDSSSLSDTVSSDSSSSESSDESAMFSQDDDSDALEFEEIQIRMNGMDSDEESNVGSSSEESSAAHRHDPPPIDDPNDMEHIWSTDDDHFNLVDLPDDTLYIIEAQELQQQQQQQHAHRSRNDCKKKLAKSVEAPSPILPSPSAASSSYSLSPEVIQNYMASRGIKISMDRALQFAKSLPCSTTTGTDFSALEKSAKLSFDSTMTPPPTPPHSATSSIPAVAPVTPSTLLSSRNSNLDPKLMTKEAKRFEALQAQAYGGMGYHHSSSSPHLFKERRRSKRATDSDLPLINIEDVVDISSYYNNDGDHKACDGAQQEDSDSNNLNSDLGSNSGSASDKCGKFLRVPVGTFRRSRRVSAPILKLSKAVKNTFGVIPRSIHETLLHPSYEMGIGPLVQKKQSSIKEMIMREKKRREKLAKNLSRLSEFRLNDFVEGSDDSDACDSSISCSCSECEDLPRQQQQQRQQGGRRSRVSSLCFDDFSAFIHDPNHPPSACTSPTNLYLTSSPRMFPSEDFE